MKHPARWASVLLALYLLTVACPCGVVFGRWATPMDAEVDLFREALLH
jgi:hypothetical protein